MASFSPLESTTGLSASRPTTMRGRGHRPVGVVIDKTCRVYITQIPVERIERDGASAMRAEFETFGPIESYKMFTERSGRFIGSALCTFRNPADAALAIANMNDLAIEGSTLKVAIARDHGVMLLHQDSDKHKSFLRNDEANAGQGEDGRWHHDKYQMIAEGKDMDEVLGIKPRMRRGRGGMHMSRGDRIDARFEEYVAERDRMMNRADNEEGISASEPQPSAEAAAEAETAATAAVGAPSPMGLEPVGEPAPATSGAPDIAGCVDIGAE